MFNTLIESKRKRETNASGTVASIIVHVVLIGAVVAVSAHAGQRVIEERRQEEVKFLEVKADEPPPPEPEAPPPPPPDVAVAPPPPQGFQVLSAPIDIPDKIPEVDLSKAVTDEADFTGRGVAGGIAKGVVGGTAPVQDQPYFEFQVERQVVPQTRVEPRFPQMLADRGQTGQVLVQFVVDTTGQVDMSTFKVLQSSNELFTREVRNVLPRWRFLPAEVGGRKVRQYVQLPITFALTQ